MFDTREDCDYAISMGGLIHPVEEFTNAVTVNDLLNSPMDRETVAHALDEALKKSFLEDAMRSGAEFARRIQTQVEVKHRSKILCQWFIRMRGDLGYSLSQTLGSMTRALRAELDGIKFEPPPPLYMPR